MPLLKICTQHCIFLACIFFFFLAVTTSFCRVSNYGRWGASWWCSPPSPSPPPSTCSSPATTAWRASGPPTWPSVPPRHRSPNCPRGPTTATARAGWAIKLNLVTADWKTLKTPISVLIDDWGRAFVHWHTFLHSWSGPMTLVVPPRPKSPNCLRGPSRLQQEQGELFIKL